MTGEVADFVTVLQVVEAERPVLAADDGALTIVHEGDSRHPGPPFRHDAQATSLFQIPEPHRPVHAAGQAQAAVGRDRDAAHSLRMALELTQRLALSKVPVPQLVFLA